jgi:hypothetical protein
MDRETDLTMVTRYDKFLPRPNLGDLVFTGLPDAMPGPPREPYVIGEWPGIDLDVLREAIQKAGKWLRR